MPQLETLELNTIIQGDCIERMQALPSGSVDLGFADPPFNIGFDYDVYEDALDSDKYVEWSREWISAIYRVLKPNGTFWLAIGDEYAAELKIASQQIGFHCRSWVIWYYTFGVNCSKKFSRSHAHLFHFVKDSSDFTFRESVPENRIPSARQLVYNDKRANSQGRLPDDTWIVRPADVVGELMDEEATWSTSHLTPPHDDDQTFTLRPQDLEQRFGEDEDTWYFPRVAGTFKERAGFHGCQMPEQLLGRIVGFCSNENDLILDPFAGSATTLAVAKKLGRRYLGFDVSADYVQHGLQRLNSIRVGDALDGSPAPLVSAPKTGLRKNPRKKKTSPGPDEHNDRNQPEKQQREKRLGATQLALTMRGIAEAFRLTHDGFSADRVVADVELNREFLNACRKLGLVGEPRVWNALLFRLRKAGKLIPIPTTERTIMSWQDCDDFLFASEIALQKMLSHQLAESLDEILCDPSLAATFDEEARRYALKPTSLELRWAALKIRKQAKVARTRAAVLTPPSRLGSPIPIEELRSNELPKQPGVYLINNAQSHKLYVGETLNLRRRLSKQFGKKKLRKNWSMVSEQIFVRLYPTNAESAEMLAWQSCLVKKYKPRLNYRELSDS